jgi:sugar phosphate isomerase/epimerase
MNSLRFEQLTFFDAGPIGVVDLAAEFGVSEVSFWTNVENAMGADALVTDENKKAVRARLEATGVAAGGVTFFPLGALDLDKWGRALDVAAYLGATSAVTINVNLAEAPAAEALAQFAELVSERGLTPLLEPISMGKTRTLEDGEQLIRRSGSADVRLLADVLHIVRTGSSPAALNALEPTLIGSAQICDGPASIPESELRQEGAFDRMVPGEGEFPLVEFVGALPADVVLGMEVPMRRLQKKGVTPRERAEMVVTGTRRIQELADRS